VLGTEKRGTHLVVAHLVLHLILPQDGIQFDHICILLDIILTSITISPKGRRGKAHTLAEYSFVVPSKHNIRVRGLRFTSIGGAEVEEEGSVAMVGGTQHG
jgi:hypothetical protein